MLDLFTHDYFKIHKNLVIVGDFNFPKINWGHRQYIMKTMFCIHLLKTFTDHFLFQHVYQNTRYRIGHNPSFLIDLLLGLVNNVRYGDKLGVIQMSIH
jgi:hypothetical protein